MKVHISPGNIKLGNIPNISFPPEVTCNKKAACRKYCYSKKAWRLYPQVRIAWTENLIYYMLMPNKFFNEVDEFLTKHKPKYFRFNCAGDFLNSGYLLKMVGLARKHPDTNFLAFTKKYNLIPEDLNLPDNLSLVISSVWNLDIPSRLQNYPKSFVNLPEEKKIPKEIRKCKKSCKMCYQCWHLKATHEKAILFEKH